MRITLRVFLLQMLLALCVCVAAFSNARAQGDIRLSTDPLQASIPDDMKIQAAGEINSLRLVVWGSTRLAGGNAVTGVIYMQMIRDTTLLGSPVVLTSAEARPFGYVRVMALADRFMVCWNDRRGVAYERIVDTTGVVGDEQALWGELLMGDIFSIPTTEGYTLLWNNARDSSIYSRRIDRNGELLGDAGIYSPGHLGAYHYPTKLPGLAILDRGNLPPILLDGTGRNIPLGAAAAKLALPYYLDNDGSVVTISSDTIREYRTILDSIPSRIFSVTLEQGAIRSTAVVSRDSARRIQVTYVANGEPSYNQASTMLIDPIKRIVEQSPGNFGKPVSISSILVLYTGAGCYSFSIHGAGSTFIRGCDNSYKINPHFVGSYEGKCHGGDTPGRLDTILPYIITSQQIIVKGWGEPLVTDALLPHDCGPDPITVSRISSLADSRVRTAIGSNVITCLAPAAIIPINIPDTYPAIMNDHGTMVVSWLSLGFDSTARLGAWSNSAIPAVDSIGAINIGAYPSAPLPVGGRRLSYASWRGNGQFLLSSYTRWTDTNNADSQRCVIYTASREGWKQGETISGSDPARRLGIISVFRNPDNNQTVIGSARITSDGWCAGVRALGLDSNGSTIWSVDSTRMNPEIHLAILPLAANNFLAVEANALLRVRSTSIDSVYFAYPDYSPVYARLFESRFARCYIKDGNMEMGIFDTVGHAAALPRSIPILPGGSDPFILQNPADSGIVVLYGGKTGTRMMLFDKNLHSLGENILVSDSAFNTVRPVAAFRGDSLYVIWEDSRNSLSDIYGRLLRVSTAVLPSKVDAEYVGAGGSSILSIIPNPVGSWMSVRVNGGSGGEREIIIHNLYGEIIMRRPLDIGSESVTMETGGVPNGIYIARISGRNNSTRFVVMH